MPSQIISCAVIEVSMNGWTSDSIVVNTSTLKEETRFLSLLMRGLALAGKIFSKHMFLGWCVRMIIATALLQQLVKSEAAEDLFIGLWLITWFFWACCMFVFWITGKDTSFVWSHFCTNGGRLNGGGVKRNISDLVSMLEVRNCVGSVISWWALLGRTKNFVKFHPMPREQCLC